jgi:hypothetical protein
MMIQIYPGFGLWVDQLRFVRWISVDFGHSGRTMLVFGFWRCDVLDRRNRRRRYHLFTRKPGLRNSIERSILSLILDLLRRTTSNSHLLA